MENEEPIITKEELLVLLDGDDDSLRTYFTTLSRAADIKEFLAHADTDTWPRLLRLVDNREKRAEVVSLLEEDQWQDLLAHLKPDEIAGLVGEMESDDAADVLGTLPLAERLEALKLLSAKDRRQVQQLLRYPDDSAGGIMQVERAQVAQTAFVKDAIETVRALVEDDVEVITVWVVDEKNCLVGTVELVDLLLNKSTTAIRGIMDTDVVTVTPLVDQEAVASLFQKYDLLALAVVDNEGHLLGRIVIDDVVDVLSEEAEEDALHMGGTSVEELLYREEVIPITRIRLPWLAVALVASLISATLLNFFESVLVKAVVVFSFVPVITAMGGNVGTQAATILIRGFATGRIELKDMPTVLFKEIRVGFLMGIVYGILAGIVATFLLSDKNYYLGLVVFISMVNSMITASAMGVFAPSLLKKLNVDPAIASGPFVTTLSDITGILIYMTTATVFLSQLIV